MPRKPKPDIGTCTCPMCGLEASVRKNNAGQLYGFCVTHGKFNESAGGQDWMLENAILFGPGGEPEPAPAAGASGLEEETIVIGAQSEPEPEPEPEPAPKREEPATGGGFLDFLNDF